MHEKKQGQGGRVRLSPHLEDAVHLCGEGLVMGAALSCGTRSLRLVHTWVGQQVRLGKKKTSKFDSSPETPPSYAVIIFQIGSPIFKTEPSVQTCDPGGENLPLNCSSDVG